ncbi:hypothetical protein LOD99_8541 [Oopsacas minuta]|uniref:Uncharacterized protein n=1 Tax=Oopsacas minuta TaxID=111878 RepID=A0AAV7JFP1_9METZ|nr:hypothetical protein LOD99_8541 [Oopsacas minuta]
MNNLQAFHFYCEHKLLSTRSIADQLISTHGFDRDQQNFFRLKFNDIQTERAPFHKYSDLDTWNSMCFCPLPKKPRLSAFSSLTINFEEDFNLSKKKSLTDLTTKGLRNRLSFLKSHLESVAENEHVSPKTLATYLLLLCCNEEQDMNSANVCKEILEKGNSSPIYPQLSLDKSAFLFDSLEIGKTKYLGLRRTLLSEDLKLPGYNSVAKHRGQINLLDEVRIIHREFHVE